MNQTSFIAFALDCGVTLAATAAAARGIAAHQIKSWVAAIPTYRDTHHYQ